MFKNTRKSNRISTNYDVKMYRQSSNSAPSRAIEAKITDLSLGGCKLKILNIQTGFAVGETILVHFNIAQFTKEPLKLKAEVRWALPDGSELGCHFLELEPKTTKIFKEIIKLLNIT